MGKYIKYERIMGKYDDDTLQELLNNLISDGKEIISYNERFDSIKHQLKNGEIQIEPVIHVTMITGKLNTANILNG